MFETDLHRVAEYLVSLASIELKFHLHHTRRLIKKHCHLDVTVAQIGISNGGWWHHTHLGSLLAGLTVQAAYPSALQRLVIKRVRLHLLPLEGGTVAGLQVGLLQRRLVLGGSFDWLHRLHVFICLELSPNGNNKSGKSMLFCK